jgi:hypothetical protein
MIDLFSEQKPLAYDEQYIESHHNRHQPSGDVHAFLDINRNKQK